MKTPDDKTIDRILRSGPAEVSPDFNERLQAAIAAAEGPPDTLRFPKGWWGGSVAAALVLILALGALLVPWEDEPNPGILPEEIYALADQLRGIDPEAFDDFQYLALGEVF